MNRRDFLVSTPALVAALGIRWQDRGVDLVVRGGRVVTSEGVVPTDVAISGGRIAALGAAETLPAPQTTIDASGKYVLPGLIDSHVHFNTPFRGTSTKEDFYTGSIAGAFGGVTTYIDFAVQPKGRDLLSVLEERRAEADPNTVVDYSLHMLLTDASPDALDQLPEVIRSGMPSVKVFMAFGREGFMIDDGALVEVMRQVEANNGIIAVHTENNAIAERLGDAYQQSGRIAARYFPETRPHYIEAEAIRRALLFARITGVRYYGFHLTIAEGVAEFRRARAEGRPVTTETCTHYLVLTDDVYRRPDGANFVCSPPIRTQRDVDALWEGIRDDAVSVVTSDHTAWDLEQKRAGGGSYVGIPHGLPSIELRLPVLYTEGVRTGRISMPRLVDILSTSLARVWGLYPRKGSLAPGSDADLVIFDPDAQWRVDPEDLHMQVDWSPYTGKRLQGRIETVISSGLVVVAEGRFTGARGGGRFIERALS